MAIGLAKLFGIDFLENFNYPYAASSITDFWRRWHISLSSWFRDYLYIPLGGNRCGRARNYFNLVIVFFLCGLWHGASWTFAAWGLFHGAFLVLERMNAGPGDRFALVTREASSTRCSLSRSAGCSSGPTPWPQATAFLKAMAGLGTGGGLEYHVGLYVDAQLVLALCAGAIGSWPVLPLCCAGERRAWLPGRRDLFGRCSTQALRWPTSSGIRCCFWPRPCFWQPGPTTHSFTSDSEMIPRARLKEEARRRPSEIFRKAAALPRRSSASRIGDMNAHRRVSHHDLLAAGGPGPRARSGFCAGREPEPGGAAGAEARSRERSGRYRVDSRRTSTIISASASGSSTGLHLRR